MYIVYHNIIAMKNKWNWRRKMNQLNNLVSGKNLAAVNQTLRVKQQKEQGRKEIVETLITQKNTLPLEMYTINTSWIIVCSNRGASLSSLILDDTEIFYNDPKKRNNPSKSIREGFRMGPQAWPFSPEQNTEYGYNLKRHWFLRDSKREKKGGTGNTVWYTFETNEDTLQQFPYSFTALQEIELGNKWVHISLNIQNKWKSTMKFAPWHHTFYRVAPDQKKDIKLSENMWVNEEMKSKRISGSETIKIPNPWSCQICIPWVGLLQLSFDSKFKHLRLRSEKDTWFVCIEPVVCLPKERKDAAIDIKPEEIMKIGFTITLLTKDRVKD